MVETQHVKDHVNRREFISAAASAGAVTALAGNTRTTRAQQSMLASDAAFQSAYTRAAALVAKMTLHEKISQTGNTSPAIKRLGLKGYQYWSEGLHGLAQGFAFGTSFPQPLALAGAWNPELNRRVYTAISDEARAWHNRGGNCLTFYSPQTLNLHRDPRWGRCEEAAGEDPCLAGTLAVQVIRGMQGDDPKYLKTTACAKHFICNNTDDDRMRVSATVSPRNFWEYYTRAYRTAVIDGAVFTVMGAYNAINGIPCCADHFLLTDVLRKRWKFHGYVTSDCDAVYNIFNPHHYAKTLPEAAADAINAGCDLNCGTTMQKFLLRAVKHKLVDETKISEAVTHILTARFLLGEFDPPGRVPYSSIPFDVVESPAHRALALDAARQSMILLKNTDHFLPLKKENLRTVAVIGPLAGDCHLGGYSGSPTVRISPADGIAAALGARIQPNGPQVWPGEVQRMSPGLGTQGSTEGGLNIGWISNGSWAEYKPQNFTGKTHLAVRVASPTSGAVIHVHIDSLAGPEIATFNVTKTGGWQHWTTLSTPISSVTGRHKVFFKFSGKEPALCNFEWFELQPVSIPAKPQPTPGHPIVTFKPGCSIVGPRNDQMFAEAVNAAKQADVVIMVCGVNQLVDGEGHDRKDTRLTGAQHELIQACFKANPKTMLVLSSNNTVAVNWEQENLPAIVGAIFAGQAQGAAIADVLFGDYNPGGKTCCTWYKSVQQLPPFHDYDIMKGRTYMYFDGQPLYPFGHGLSYTTFKYTDLHISTATLAANQSVTISLTITNTGPATGAEVVQLYVQAPKSKVKRPIKQLVGFQRLELKPAQSRRVSFTLPYTEQALWYWDDQQHKFVLEPGTLKVMIGGSSADIRLHDTVTLLPCADARLGGPETLSTVAAASKVS